MQNLPMLKFRVIKLIKLFKGFWDVCLLMKKTCNPIIGGYSYRIRCTSNDSQSRSGQVDKRHIPAYPYIRCLHNYGASFILLINICKQISLNYYHSWDKTSIGIFQGFIL